MGPSEKVGTETIFCFSKKWFLSLLFLVVVLSLSCASGEARVEKFPFVGVVLRDDVNVRAGSSLNSEVLTQLKKDSFVVVLAEGYNWYRIELPQDAQVYVSSKYIKKLSPAKGRITGDKVNIRAGAGTEFNILGQLNKSDEVAIVKASSGWFAIRPPKGICGWTRADFIGYHLSLEEYINQQNKKRRLLKRLDELDRRLDAELNKPPEEARLEPLLDAYESLYSEHSQYLEAERALAKSGLIRVKLLQHEALRMREALEGAKENLEEAHQRLEESLVKLKQQAPEVIEIVEESPPIAVGVIEDLGMIINRPAAYKLITDENRFFCLRSDDDSINFNKYIHRKVEVWGRITFQSEFEHPVIHATKLEPVE